MRGLEEKGVMKAAIASSPECDRGSKEAVDYTLENVGSLR